jgi:hypothetical protein
METGDTIAEVVAGLVSEAKKKARAVGQLPGHGHRKGVSDDESKDNKKRGGSASGKNAC